MIELIVVIILILCNGFLALSEMAVMTSRKSRLRQLAAHSRRARLALELSENPESFLSSVQVWITLLGLMTGYFGAEAVAQHLNGPFEAFEVTAPYATKLAYIFSFVTITFLTVVLGELLPKRLAIVSPERLAMIVAMPVRVLSIIARPAVIALSATTSMCLKILGLGSVAGENITEEEIRLLVAEGHEQGVIDVDERNMVNRVLRLGDRTAESLMTPRPRIIWLDADEPLIANLAIMRTTPFSRYPVYRGSDDQVLGVLEVKSLVGKMGKITDSIFSDLRPALFVSEFTGSLKLLEIFREESQTMALVVDEYGDIVGMVTTNDLLGAVIGRNQSTESPSFESAIITRSDGSWLVDGRVSTEDLRELLSVGELPGESEQDFHTAAGMMISWFGRIPHSGEHFVWKGFRFEVIDLDGARVDKLLISRDLMGEQEPIN